jgi:hypothetical protein
MLSWLFRKAVEGTSILQPRIDDGEGGTDTIVIADARVGRDQ